MLGTGSVRLRRRSSRRTGIKRASSCAPENELGPRCLATGNVCRQGSLSVGTIPLKAWARNSAELLRSLARIKSSVLRERAKLLLPVAAHRHASTDAIIASDRTALTATGTAPTWHVRRNDLTEREREPAALLARLQALRSALPSRW